MSIGRRNFTLAQLTLGLCLAAGCGGDSNTVEMPSTPAPPPSTGPIGAEPDAPADPAAGTTLIEATPATEP